MRMGDGVRVITDDMDETQGTPAKPTFLTDGRNAKIIMRAIKAVHPYEEPLINVLPLVATSMEWK